MNSLFTTRAFFIFGIKKKIYFSPGGLSYNSTRSSSLFDCVCIARSRKGEKKENVLPSKLYIFRLSAIYLDSVSKRLVEVRYMKK